jgi:hypothetical protein
MSLRANRRTVFWIPLWTLYTTGTVPYTYCTRTSLLYDDQVAYFSNADEGTQRSWPRRRRLLTYTAWAVHPRRNKPRIHRTWIWGFEKKWNKFKIPYFSNSEDVLSTGLFSLSLSLLFSFLTDGQENTVVTITCVGHWILDLVTLCVNTLHSTLRSNQWSIRKRHRRMIGIYKYSALMLRMFAVPRTAHHGRDEAEFNDEQCCEQNGKEFLYKEILHVESK